jgi:hypothetical protein
MAFLIEVVKSLVAFIAVCIGIGALYLVFVVVREVGWLIKQENRKQYKEKQEEKENEDGSI